jgi:hypothetical protein
LPSAAWSILMEAIKPLMGVLSFGKE